MEPTDLEYLSQHIFLPPKLPQENDWDSMRDAALTTEAYSALKSFDEISHDRGSSPLAVPIQILGSMLESREFGELLLSAKVESQIGTMDHRGTKSSN
jgi:hypothetical protein